MKLCHLLTLALTKYGLVGILLLHSWKVKIGLVFTLHNHFQGEQPHCGFPEKNFSINVEKLARKVVKHSV